MRCLALLTSLLPVAAFAAGTDSSTPPKSACKAGYVYDVMSDKCVKPQSGHVDDMMRLDAVRGYAYEGKFADALMVLDAMDDQQADGVLTYRGFIARMSGDMDGAKRWYDAALAQNPDNLLARSYMGQGLVLEGDWVGAKRQYDEIIARGGRGTWAEASLRDAITTGTTYTY
ncbi:tetratricopeptide repeat protein [Sagittula sp.]|jgi:tetratricopeptide (TPR) repeat protein|uniref:tetratricopeptide repeat protein n=1 Tax=Sagittula sp. TaxID=2038081 RepID=UPI003514E43A